MFQISIPWCKSVIKVATAPHCNGHAQHIAFDMQYTKSSHHCEIVRITKCSMRKALLSTLLVVPLVYEYIKVCLFRFNFIELKSCSQKLSSYYPSNSSTRNSLVSLIHGPDTTNPCEAKFNQNWLTQSAVRLFDSIISDTHK